jgi:hypothetical protein
VRRTERGGVAILAACIVVLTGLVLVGVARAGSAAGRSARADTAADAAALAAALTLARGGDTVAAGFAAAEVARTDGATLESCDCHDGHAEVVVGVDGAVGRARAEVDGRCLLVPGRCTGAGA